MVGGIPVNALDDQSKTHSITVETHRTGFTTGLNVARHHVNVDEGRPVDRGPRQVDSEGCFVGRRERSGVVGVHRIRIVGGRRSVCLELVGQQDRSILKANPQLKVVDDGGFRLGWKRHSNAYVFTFNRREALREHFTGLKERACCSLPRPALPEPCQVVRLATVRLKPCANA